MARLKSSRLEVWQHRQEFLQAAQRTLPEFGRYLRRYGVPAEGEIRSNVIRHWQKHFNLRRQWAFQCAWMTLAVWDRHAEYRQSLQWFAAPPAGNLAAGGLFTFKCSVEREFHHDLDFGWFKQSIHGALEAELEVFGKSIGAEDLGSRRQPKDLRRAYECLALRVCRGLSPQQISSRPAYRRDWTTLSRAIKSAAELVGMKPPNLGRPPKNIAR